jgi:2,3-bisphosphoglycerate-independent phosphoglycerate mutase
MSAFEVADVTEESIRSGKYDLVVVNFANCDMVGHTGNFDSTVKAVEVVDECVGKLIKAVIDTDAVALITADHGNAEEMFDSVLNEPKTAHTTNPVHLFYVATVTKGMKISTHGILADISPTILHLLDIKIPAPMTARNLIKI